MNPRDLTYEALDFIGISTISGASPHQLGRIARDMTSALAWLYDKCPAIYKRRDGALIAAPQTVSVTATAGSKTITCGTTLVEGSTILITGDANVFNQVHISGGTKSLRIPFGGISGTYPATVWGDSVLIDATVDRVLGAVMLNERVELTKRVNRTDALTRRFPQPDYGRRFPSQPTNLTQGQPYAYWVETSFESDGTLTLQTSSIRMRIYPLPKAAYSLAFDVGVGSPRVVVADLGTDGADSTKALVIPSDMIESALRPLFLKRWSGGPWFKDKEKAMAIAEEAKEAETLLRNYRPQQPSNRRIVAPL